MASEEGDWASQVADTIETFVGTVRDKTTGPALQIAKAVVYGMFALIVGITALAIFVILSVRLLDVYLPDAVFGESHTWAAHLINGVLFTAVGAVAWFRRKPPKEQTTHP